MTLGGLQSQSGQSGEEKNLVLAGNQTTFSPQNSSCTHYTNVAPVPYLVPILHCLDYPGYCSLFIRLVPILPTLSWLWLPLYQTSSYTA